MQYFNEQKTRSLYSHLIIDSRQIEKCIQNYDESRWFFGKLLYGDNEEIKQCKLFLRKLGYIGKLTPADFFAFINIIQNKSTTPIIRSLRKLIADEHFFKLIACLDHFHLASPESYYAIAQLNTEEHKTLYFLLANVMNTTKKNLDFLIKHDLLNKLTIDLLRIDIDISHSLSLIKRKDSVLFLLILDNAKILNDKILATLSTELLDEDAFIQCIVLLSHEKVLNQEIFDLLLSHAKKGWYELDQSHKIFILFQKHQLLTIQNVLWFSHQSEKYKLFDAMNVLSQSNLLDQSIFIKLPKSISDFSSVLCFLSEIKSLNKNTLASTIEYFSKRDESIWANDFVELIETFKKAKFKLSNENYHALTSKNIYFFKYIKAAINCLIESHLDTNKNIDNLLALSKERLDEMSSLIKRLHENKLLDQHSFDKALSTLINELKTPEKASVTKFSRKDSSLPRSEFIINNNLHVFVEHTAHDPNNKYKKRYASGGCAIVKKGYKTPTDDEPAYAVKILRESRESEGEHEIKSETMYQRLLGCDAYYFQRESKMRCKSYSLSLWKKGKDLDAYKKSELLHYPLATRLTWLISGLSDLKILHQMYTIHGDIKPANFILDTHNATMRLIDFGSTRKRYEAATVYTPLFLPPNGLSELFSTDIYSMGIVAAWIFPELYLVDTSSDHAKISKIKKENTTPLERGITNLIDVMLSEKDSLRCSAEDALKYSQHLSLNRNDLDDMAILTITQQTIDHSRLSVEDVIHGCYRAKSIGQNSG